MQSFKCDIAHNGRDAMDLVKERFEKDKSSYQLIMMEYYMPLGNGSETTAMIRNYLSKNAPDLPQPYIAGMSSTISGEGLESKAMESGMDAFVAKPIFSKAVQNVIASAKLNFS